ncbi:MAG TPA: PhoH family protein [Polyangia bacterium]|jgi:PhoH-like ATPase
MLKNFVLDTNVLLHDPQAIFKFEENNVYIPITVIEEVDTFKKELTERGRNARTIARLLDNLREQGPLSHGVRLPGGGRVAVNFAKRELPEPLRASQVADNWILAVALDVRDKAGGMPTVFVTKDVNLRIRADALGLTTQDYLAESVDIEELYSGTGEIDVTDADIDLFYQQNFLPLAKDEDHPHYPNQYLLLKAKENANHSALGRVDASGDKLTPVKKVREGVFGIRPRNKEQHYALDLLLNDEIKLVTLVGKAGTGKTLLAIAAGLQKTVEDGTFQKLLVSRPVFPLGRDIGYLPGSVEEKLNPWMQPIYDNVELLLGFSRSDKKEGRSYKELMDLGYIQIEPLTYIRGRSIPNQYMIIDEAQNLTPHEIKTIITRVGDNTKIILTGDPYQIDNPYIDASNNGLTTVVERFKGQAISGHVTLTKGERSALAELASNILESSGARPRPQPQAT